MRLASVVFFVTMLVACTSAGTAPPLDTNVGAPSANAISVDEPPSSGESEAMQRTTLGTGSTVLFHEFKTECDTDVDNADGDGPPTEPAFIDAAQDPILFPGQANPPMQHVHTFWGNLAISPSANVSTLLASPSTCNMVGGHQAWWIPQASLDGVAVHPKAIVVYYKMGPDGFNAHITPFTNGIRILAGKSTQSQSDFAQIGSWTCGNLPRTSDVPDTCPAGSDLVVRLDAPHCMADVTQTDSLTHRTHIVYDVKLPSGGRACPADHPIAVPMPVWKISYAVSGGNLKSRLKFLS